MKNITETPYSSAWIENGILHLVYKPNLIIDLDIAKQMVTHRMEAANNITLPALIDIRNLVSIQADARKYLAGPEGIKHISAGAILLDSYLQFLAGTVFLKIDIPLIPSRLFTDKESALLWLEKFKSSN